MTDIAQLHRELVSRVLDSEASAPPGRRRAAFDNAGLDGAVQTLVEKVAARSYAVTDDDVAAARAAGLSEDQVFEVVVCAAVGAADRQYTNAMAALAEATEVGDEA
jgi:alkylhydroperoxidase family enzyme